MHDFLIDEEKYKDALQLLCEVISLDLSGHGNEENMPNLIAQIHEYKDSVI